jgi:hemolysin D
MPFLGEARWVFEQAQVYFEAAWHWGSSQWSGLPWGGVAAPQAWPAVLAVSLGLTTVFVLYRALPRFRETGRRTDREFLPAALAILETPPSPAKVWLIWTICGLFAFAVGWTYWGRIDIIATAQGKIQPRGRVKTIQPVETGKVIAIHAANGQHVAQGAVLIALDDAEAKADHADAATQLLAFQAELLRRLSALSAVQGPSVETGAAVAWPQDVPPSMRLREERVLGGDLRQLAANVKSFDAQIVQKKAEQERLKQTIAAQETLIATLQERVNMRTILEATQAGSKASRIDAQETLQVQQTALATQKGQLAEAQAAAVVLVQDREKAVETFKAENGQKLADAERQIDDFSQKEAKAAAKLGHMTITSPIGGMVLGLSVTTLGQVVNPSEEIMRIVPDGTELEIEAYLENKDIGFVEPGQAAIVKVESFPFTRYGVLDASVLRVAHDAIPEPDAQTVEGNPAKTTKQSFFGSAQRTQNLVFPVTLSLAQTSMDIDGVAVPLRPGMTASVEVKTGKRRILEYLFSPLVQTVSSAMRER